MGSFTSLKLFFLFLAAVSADNTEQIEKSIEGMYPLYDYSKEHSDYSEIKIPERIVHSKGVGARGYFEVTHDISHLTKASVFQLGKKTPVLARLSPGTPGRKLPDSWQTKRGLAVRFFAEDGSIFDMTTMTIKPFLFHDSWDIPLFIPLLLRKTNNTALNVILERHPEAINHLLWQYSYVGSPIDYRHMDTSGVHTFKFINDQGTPTYVRYELRSEQGTKYQDAATAKEKFSTPDYASDDLRNAIKSGDFPSWKLMIQTMSFDVARKVPFDPVDATYLWPESEFPFQPVGRLVLDKLPEDYIEEVEKTAYNPGNLIPGIEPSHDLNLLFRTVSYIKAHEARLGEDYNNIPVNKPKNPAHQLQREGINQEHVIRNDVNKCNFAQAAEYYRSRPAEERRQIASIFADNFKGVPDDLREKQLGHFANIDPELANMIRELAPK